MGGRCAGRASPMELLAPYASSVRHIGKVSDPQIRSNRPGQVLSAKGIMGMAGFRIPLCLFAASLRIHERHISSSVRVEEGATSATW